MPPKQKGKQMKLEDVKMKNADKVLDKDDKRIKLINSVQNHMIKLLEDLYYHEDEIQSGAPFVKFVENNEYEFMILGSTFILDDEHKCTLYLEFPDYKERINEI